MPAALQTSLIYGHLAVLSVSYSSTTRHRMALCRCVCGTIKSFRLSDLTSDSILSCGCKQHVRKHSGRNTPTWWTWKAMRRRCSDPDHRDFKYYGGRGIRVCDEWNDPKNGFVRFLADMGERPADRTLDRVEVNGNYEKSNCRWATATEQAFNKRRWTRTNERRKVLRDERQRELQSENAHWDEEEAAYLASATMTGECTPSPSSPGA